MKILKILFVLILFGLKTWAKPNTAIISGNIPFLKDSDEVVLIMFKYGEPQFTGDEKRVSCRVLNHKFYFEQAVGSIPIIFGLGFNEKINNPQHGSGYMKLNIMYGLIKDGDNITIAQNENGVKFSGPGSEKNIIIQQFSEYYRRHVILSIGFRFKPEFVKQYFTSQDTITRKSLQYLEEHKQLLDSNEYGLLKAMAISYYYDKGRYLWAMSDSLKRESVRILKSNNTQENPPVSFQDQFFSKEILKYSDQLSNAILHKYIYDSCYVKNKALDIAGCYNYIVNNFKGPLKERLLTNLLFEHKDSSKGHLLLIEKALTILKDRDFIAILKKLRASRSEGAVAHNFILPDINGIMRSLTDYKGKIVILDFWFTGCGSCALLSPHLTKIEKSFEGKPVVFLSINLDNSKTQWEKSMGTGKYTSPYAINLTTASLGFRHSVVENYAIDACPTLILIDQQGKVMNNAISPLDDHGKDLTVRITRAIGK